MLSERIGVDAGVGGRRDGPFRGGVVGLQPVVEASVVGEGEQGLLRDSVDRVGSGQPAQIIGVGQVLASPGSRGQPEHRNVRSGPDQGGAYPATSTAAVCSVWLRSPRTEGDRHVFE
jgi:hypothetical protein